MPRIPRYPIYIPTKGRSGDPCTARMFSKYGVPFRLVVEPQEVEAYKEFKEHLCVLPDNDKGLIFARNFIKQHSIDEGHARHWQFDDDIMWMSRLHRGYRLQCPPNVAIVLAEDFVERYENVALCSFNSIHFVPSSKGSGPKIPPFYLNQRCYTVFLMLNSLPNKWRYRYNEDTDMTLQVLADGWCTILFNAFMIYTKSTTANSTGVSGGGGQAGVYAGDGRLKMARDLERVWPGVVETKRRFNRPQHHVKGDWKMFDTPLKRRTDVDFNSFPAINEHGLKLKAVKTVKSAHLKKLVEDA